MTLESPRVLAWSDEYAVGVPEIDAQHRRLFEMLADFYDKLAEPTHAAEAMGDLVCGLLDYTRFHFTTEERLMRQAGFPESDAHRAQHAAFIARVSDMADRFSQGRLVLTLEATAFLRDWLFGHILKTDRELAKHLLESAKER